jgi:putative transcriptional regulator
MPIRIRLNDLMKARGVTAAQLSKETGIMEATLSEWRRSVVARISLDTLDILCTALNCEPGDLLVRDPTAPARPPRAKKSRKSVPASLTYPATPPTTRTIHEG